jgi:DNA-binding MarR family transcriptional regulator|tara:strand:- start:174 stop:431 length:258 start_codon:yes stop_codon:yes gene_type:complete
MIHPNSLSAIDSIAPVVTGAARIEVLKVIKEQGPITRQDIGAALGWEINRVTGRVRELLDKNNIIESGDDTSHSKKRGLLWPISL